MEGEEEGGKGKGRVGGSDEEGREKEGKRKRRERTGRGRAFESLSSCSAAYSYSQTHALNPQVVLLLCSNWTISSNRIHPFGLLVNLFAWREGRGPPAVFRGHSKQDLGDARDHLASDVPVIRLTVVPFDLKSLRECAEAPLLHWACF